MRVALDEAAKGLGRTRPNPVVGAAIVKNGRLLAKGYHAVAGGPHAEVVVLSAVGARAKGADLYTTLEPCNHFGRTPPCTEAIVKAGIRRVICASSDPNPTEVDGKGLARLRRAGVEVVTHVLRAEADRLNRPYFKHVRTGLPWVTLKAAITWDGKLATGTGDSRWVSGEASREKVHRLRDQVDAILVGTNTARKDDPRLTTRLPEGGGRNPLRVVLDAELSLPLRANLFDSSARTVVATTQAESSPKARKLAARGVEVWTLRGKGDRVGPSALLRKLGKEGVMHLLVEGGAELFGELVKQKLCDEVMLFVAPKLVGGQGLSWLSALPARKMSSAVRLEATSFEASGQDLLLRGLFPWATGSALEAAMEETCSPG